MAMLLARNVRFCFHLKCIGPQFEKYRTCSNCPVVVTTADVNGPSGIKISLSYLI